MAGGSGGGSLVLRGPPHHPWAPFPASALLSAPRCPAPLPCTFASSRLPRPSLLWAPLDPTGLPASHGVLASTAIRSGEPHLHLSCLSPAGSLLTIRSQCQAEKGLAQGHPWGVVGVLQRRLGAGPLTDAGPGRRPFPPVPPFRHSWIHIFAHSPSPYLLSALLGQALCGL